MKLILILAALIIFLTSCKDSITESQIDDVVIPDSDVSFSKYIQPIFNVKCANTYCHDSYSKAGDLDLTTWSTATEDPQIISRGDPSSSILVWTIDPEFEYVIKMPPAKFLTDNQIEGIKTWIAEGALAN